MIPLSALLLSGCPGDTRRYRLFHQAEALAHAGWSVQVRVTDNEWDPDEPPLGEILVLHRVPWDERVATLVDRARRAGASVVFDTDDLVFQPERTDTIAGIQGWPEAVRAAFAATVARYRQTLDACDAGLAPTEYLAGEIREAGLPAAVARNAIDLELLRLSTTALARHRRDDDRIVIGYASGTPTHDHDFALVRAPLMSIMDAHPQVVLRIVGYLDMGAGWELYADRIERSPYMTWRRLPAVIAGFDINLAPLVAGDPFCESKSELKYIEAGAVAVPTVASPTGAFRHAIQPGANGCLAVTTGEWAAVIDALVTDVEHRRAIGCAARADVLARYVTDVRGPEIAAALGWVTGRSAEHEPGVAHRLTATVFRTSRGIRDGLGHVPAPLPPKGGKGPGDRAGRTGRVCDDRPNRHPTSAAESIDSAIPDGLAGRRRETLARTIVDRLHEVGADVREVVVAAASDLGDAASESAAASRRCDLAIATSVELAPLAVRSAARTAMLVADDYAPFHYPMGAERVLAERAYMAGLTVATLGPWLARWLSERHGLATVPLGYPLDPRIHHPAGRRADEPPRVVYNARGMAVAGAEDLGIRALSLLRDWVPNVEIVLHDVPAVPWRPHFQYHDAGHIDDAGRAACYRSATAALFTVFTNPSLEMAAVMACGCIVVAVDTAPVRWLLHDDVNAALGAPTAEALCARLVQLLTAADVRERLAAGASVAVERMSRERTADRFIVAVAQALAGSGGANMAAGDARTSAGEASVSAPEAGESAAEAHAAESQEVPHAAPDPRGLVLDQLQPIADAAFLPLADNHSVGQTFRARLDGLCQVDALVRPGVSADAPVILRLRSDPAAVEDLAVCQVEPAAIIAAEWTAFAFEPLADSAGRHFYARFESPAGDASDGPHVQLCQSDVFAGGRTVIDGEISSTTLPFRTFCRPGVRSPDLAPDLPSRDDPLARQLEELGVEVQVLQQTLARDHAALPYRMLARLAAYARRYRLR